LQQKREEDPGLSFKDFWVVLQEEFSGDLTRQQRNLWRGVKLDTTPPLNGEKWKKFRREFDLRKFRVSDWTETEEYDLILGQLPEFYQVRVGIEENKRNKGRFWAKISNLKGVTVAELEEEISGILGGKVERVEETPKGFLVECDSERLRRRLLGMDGAEINGALVKVVRVERKLTGKEIFELVGEDLKVRDEVKKKRGVDASNSASKESPKTPKESPKSSPHSSPKNPPYPPRRWDKERVREVQVEAPLPYYGGWNPSSQYSWGGSRHLNLPGIPPIAGMVGEGVERRGGGCNASG
jgi:hypothetical protein